MKLTFFVGTLLLICGCDVGLSDKLKITDGPIVSTNIYRKAVIDVKNEGHSAGEKQDDNDAIYIEGLIWDHLRDVGISVALSEQDKTNAELQVVCRFKHGLGRPIITPGFQVKSSFIDRCTLRFTEKSGRVLIEKSWIKNKKSGELEAFIKSAFEDFKKQLDTKKFTR